LRRREFIAGICGTAAWAFHARAEQQVPTVAFVTARSAAASKRAVAAFREGLGETGYVEHRNAIIEYHWLDSQFDRLPELMADLVRRRVAVIASPNNTLITITAKAATATIPIVFSVGIDPVKTGLVASFGRPRGNATGIHYLALELTAKRLELLRALAPKPRAWLFSSIQPTVRAQAKHCAALRRRPTPPGCKPRFLTPAQAAKSMRPSRDLRRSAGMISP
jgi:putative tryptophan/tyrosine transport system substrate-binding protein